MNLIYLVAFGETYLEQFHCILPKLLQTGQDLALITDVDIQFEGVKTVIVSTPMEKQAMFKYRVKGHKLIQFSQYDAVCYMDTDIILKGNIFEKYNSDVYAASEPETFMDNEHFSELLTAREKLKAHKMPALNSGLVIVGKEMINFWKRWEDITEWSYMRRGWIAEQHALNFLYFHEAARWRMKLIDPIDMGWPAKLTKGKYADHFICLSNNDKLVWMKERV